MLIDTHCHLTSPEFDGRVAVVLREARAVGVERLILVAVNRGDAEAAVGLLKAHRELSLVAGIHPHEAGRCGPDDLAALDSLFREAAAAGLEGRLVGVGETGLDFHYDFAPRAQQEAVLRSQLELAVAHRRPVVIHARESEDVVCDTLAGYPALHGRVVFHCFSGDVALARRALDLGCTLSFTGVVTFKKAENIRAAARFAPRDRIMLETDAPYLSPEPVRKTRPNEPALLVHTARFLATLRGEDYDTLAGATTANAVRFFSLPEV